MFIVKASYKHETRKFSFESESFPTYTQLHEQVSPRSTRPYSRCLSPHFPAYSSLSYHSFYNPFSFVLLPTLHNPRDHPHRYSGHQR